MLKHISRISAVAALVALGGCVQQSAPPALTDISAHVCAATPDLSRATALAFDEKNELVLKAEITDISPCMKIGSGSGLYAVYALPPASAPYVISVISMAQGSTLLVPRVLLVGPDGTVKREFSGDQVSYRNGGMGAVLRSHAGEAYVIVVSDPEAAGKTDSRVEEATHVSTSAYRYGSFQIHTGTDKTQTFNLSYNGHIEITLTPLTPAK
jgi:hypothetical protein